MNQFQKNVVFIAIIACVVAGIGVGINYELHERALKVEEQKIQWRKANIKSLKRLSAVGAFSTEEQQRLDNAGDDFERLQQVLLDIHQQRITYWYEMAKDLAKRQRELRGLYTQTTVWGLSGLYSGAEHELGEQGREIAVNIVGYEQAEANIRKWKSVSFDDYCEGKLIDNRSSTPPTVNKDGPGGADSIRQQYRLKALKENPRRQTVIRGCIHGTPNHYILTDKSGRTYLLRGGLLKNSDSAVAIYVGEEVNITGGRGMANAFEVATITRVNPFCTLSR